MIILVNLRSLPMAIVESKVELDASIEEVFEFISNPKNIERVYPKEMNFKVLYMPEKIQDGAIISMSARLLGQVFKWNTVIRDFKRPYGFVDEAVDSPFKYWRHKHALYSINDRCIMEDRIEFSTILGFIGDSFAQRMISNILEYRNALISKLFSSYNADYIDTTNEEARYRMRDPTIISIRKGTALSIIMVIFALALPHITNLARGLLSELLLGFIAWFLLWFFTHDLMHLIVGRVVGIRFSHYYIGLSNLTRALPLRPRYKLLFIALGIKIDRSKSNASGRAYAAMYIAGPIATMLTPFYVPILYILYNFSIEASTILLSLSLLNLVLDAILSTKHGCIRKGVRALTRH